MHIQQTAAGYTRQTPAGFRCITGHGLVRNTLRAWGYQQVLGMWHARWDLIKASKPYAPKRMLQLLVTNLAHGCASCISLILTTSHLEAHGEEAAAANTIQTIRLQ